MKKIIETYKSMPPEMRILVAMLGLGTPAGMIYMLAKLLHRPIEQVLFGLVVVVAVIGLAGFGVSRIFGLRARRRTRRMAEELTSDAGRGPVSMDLRASIKANNDKFTAAIREMRKNLRVSIYDLPWYIVIGDSGCGKTKLINEGGLTFSTGKPEGYQLGTLNYNWWFTEDAIFIDMAGRLCNPQDDADRREWTALLDTVAKGRPGFPINGAVVCISAEHLLQDAPEKIEQDANTVLERLRDLQSKLGVTFGTYLVITKCDKVLGFMQFFDRAERDITIKNQIFGWSKPGSFNELYDPEKFAQDFNQLYQRLSDLRMRRLADESDDVELGNAYSFPEEFRAFRDPLQIYVRTLFPPIRNPRGVKNLIFRGAYFTSATQQGGLILKHVVERLGAQAAEHLASPLESLYPRPRPHFVKDLLFRKVFPEHGLVFRNEQQVIRNRKLAKMLWVGSGVAGVVLFALMILCLMTFNGLIGQAEKDVAKAPDTVNNAVDAFTLAGVLGADAERLSQSRWSTWFLSLGIGADKPVRGVRTVQAGLFARGVLAAALKDVEAALAAPDALKAEPADLPAEPFAAGSGGAAFRAALRNYTAWYALSSQQAAGATDDPWPALETMCKVVKDPKSIICYQAKADKPAAGATDVPAEGMSFATLASTCFSLMRSGMGPAWAHPAALLQHKPLAPQATIAAACGSLHKYLRRYATLGPDNPDPILREWARLMDACRQIETSYNQILDATAKVPGSLEEFETLRAAFHRAYQGEGGDLGFARAQAELAWKPAVKEAAVERLAAAIDRQRGYWQQCQADIRNQKAAGEAATAIQAAAGSILDGVPGLEPQGLDEILWQGLSRAKLTEEGFRRNLLASSPFAGENRVAREVFDRYGHILRLVPAKDKDSRDALEKAAEAEVAAEVLSDVNNALDKVNPEPAGDLQQIQMGWLLEEFGRLNPDRPAARKAIPLDLSSPQWRKDDLQQLQDHYQEWIARADGTRLLRTIDRRIAAAGAWGLGELEPDWQKSVPSHFEYNDVPVAEPQEPAQASEEPVAAERPSLRRLSRRRSAEPQAQQPPPVASRPERRGERRESRSAGASQQMARPATRDFCLQVLDDYLTLQEELSLFGKEHYFTSGGDDMVGRCRDAARAALGRYLARYVTAWNTAYQRKIEEFKGLSARLREAASWQEFVSQLKRSQSTGDLPTARLLKDRAEAALDVLLQSTRWLTYAPSPAGIWVEEDVSVPFYAAFHDGALWPHGFKPDLNYKALVPSSASPQSLPWRLVAAAVATEWENLYRGIEANEVLPVRFGKDIDKTNAIPWGGLDRIRKETLPDEALTGELVGIEARARALLSRDVTRILCDLQKEYLGDRNSETGWPVPPGEHAATDLSAVPIDRFRDFLLEVQRAQDILGPLEKGLADDARFPRDDLRSQRATFYRQCREWSDFLLRSGTAEAPEYEPLSVVVYVDDPLSPPLGKDRISEGSPEYYDIALLYLGLRLKDSDSASGSIAPMEFKTVKVAENERKTYLWEWRAAPAGQSDSLYFQLTRGQHGRADSDRKTLGEVSELSLPVYLLANGVEAEPSRKVWVVSHAFDIEAGKRIGMKFVFELARPLPRPIVPLKRPT